jgi:DNA-binding NtrC family response regulator
MTQRILFVDDGRELKAPMKIMLEEAGLSVDFARPMHRPRGVSSTNDIRQSCFIYSWMAHIRGTGWSSLTSNENFGID